jgi:hypothetical protein
MGFSFAQDTGRFWCFGDSAGIDFSNTSLPVPTMSMMDCPYSCSSVSDNQGLLMYAHTSYYPQIILGSLRTTVIHNRYHKVMQNGDSLIGRAFYNGLTFINKPGNDSLYYLFQWGFNQDAGLYYSLVDPYFNNDSGIVLFKNIKLQLSDSSLQTGVIAIRHGNGRDWWIITRNGTNSNRFNLFHISPDFISGPIEQNIGTITSTNSTQLSYSHQGNRLAMVTSYPNLTEVYDFDRCTGIISNPISIPIPGSTYRMFGSEFSPNGEILYVVNGDNIFGDSLRLFQINLSVPDPANSIQEIYKALVPASGGNLRRGPDAKIYLSCLYEVGWPYPDSSRNIYNENLSVINIPDSMGLACDFVPFSFYLGSKRTYWSLPNNANFQLGALVGSACDSLTSSINITKTEFYEMYPNPTSGVVNFIFRNDMMRSIRVFDIFGKVLFYRNAQSRYYKIDLSGLMAGTYYIKVSGEPLRKLLIIR